MIIRDPRVLLMSVWLPILGMMGFARAQSGTCCYSMDSRPVESSYGYVNITVSHTAASKEDVRLRVFITFPGEYAELTNSTAWPPEADNKIRCERIDPNANILDCTSSTNYFAAMFMANTRYRSMKIEKIEALGVECELTDGLECPNYTAKVEPKFGIDTMVDLGPLGRNPFWVWLLIGLSILGFIVVAAVYLIRKNRRKAETAKKNAIEIDPVFQSRLAMVQSQDAAYNGSGMSETKQGSKSASMSAEDRVALRLLTGGDMGGGVKRGNIDGLRHRSSPGTNVGGVNDEDDDDKPLDAISVVNNVVTIKKPVVKNGGNNNNNGYSNVKKPITKKPSNDSDEDEDLPLAQIPVPSLPSKKPEIKPITVKNLYENASVAISIAPSPTPQSTTSDDVPLADISDIPKPKSHNNNNNNSKKQLQIPKPKPIQKLQLPKPIAQDSPSEDRPLSEIVMTPKKEKENLKSPNTRISIGSNSDFHSPRPGSIN